MKICNSLNCDVIKLVGEEIPKQIFNDLNILPINEYYSNTIQKNISVYIGAKILVKYLNEHNIKEVYE